MKRIALLSVLMATGMATAPFAQTDTATTTRGAHAGMMPAFADLDTDGNGEISTAEVTAWQTARFAEADTDGSGDITAEEIAAHMQQQQAERHAQRMLSQLDTDDSGTISAEEMAASPMAKGATRMFERFDADVSPD